MTQAVVLRVLCKDQPGIVARITGEIWKQGGNILDLEQHAEEDSGLFAMRLQIEGLEDAKAFYENLRRQKDFRDFQCWMDDTARKLRVAILVTKESACLYDLLHKHQTGELCCEIPLIMSNHKDLAPVGKQFGIPFHVLPVKADAKAQQEAKIEALLKTHRVDLTVLARYMQILSNDFVAIRQGSIINIHHSFLPAFKGADPYRQAWERGVKMIGATAHYVTADLDEGPILHQATVEVSHHYSVEELRRAGRDLERQVLARAVRAHLEHRVLLVGKRAIVFHF